MTHRTMIELSYHGVTSCSWKNSYIIKSVYFRSIVMLKYSMLFEMHTGLSKIKQIFALGTYNIQHLFLELQLVRDPLKNMNMLEFLISL